MTSKVKHFIIAKLLAFYIRHKLKKPLKETAMLSTNWWQSRTIWAALIGIIAWAVALLTKGAVTIGADEQAQAIDLIINLIGAIVPLVSFIVVIVRKIIDQGKAKELIAKVPK